MKVLPSPRCEPVQTRLMPSLCGGAGTRLCSMRSPSSTLSLLWCAESGARIGESVKSVVVPLGFQLS